MNREPDPKKTSSTFKCIFWKSRAPKSVFNPESILVVVTPREGPDTSEPPHSRGQKALAAVLPLQTQWEASRLAELSGSFSGRVGVYSTRGPNADVGLCSWLMSVVTATFF